MIPESLSDMSHQLCLLQLISLIISTSSVHANYELIEDYTPDTFLDKFDFYVKTTPASDFVNYVNKEEALRTGLFKVGFLKLHQNWGTFFCVNKETSYCYSSSTFLFFRSKTIEFIWVSTMKIDPHLQLVATVSVCIQKNSFYMVFLY